MAPGFVKYSIFTVQPMQLSAIYRYPVKSAKGHALDSATMDRFGIAGDRRWMLVDASGRFCSQRNLPHMALLGAEPSEEGLRLTYDGAHCDVAIPDPRGERVIARVWEDTVVAPVADAPVNSWLSDIFAQPLRLVYYPDDALRGVEPGYAPSSQLVNFADGFPLLLVSEASLELLNTRLEQPVPMDRFRPNLVLSGAEPNAEDGWKVLRIGAVEVRLVKACSRCAVPSIDQQTADRDPDINRALAEYRRRDGVIYFGMNAIAPPGAMFRVGDEATVIQA